MANKPLYYESNKSTPAYYGGSGAPAYYGGGQVYGNSQGMGTVNGMAGEDGSVLGTISFSRMVRVLSQRWLSVFVFLIVGLVVALVVYRISPTIYQASSEFTMDMRRSSGSRGGGTIAEITPDYGTSYAEIFNTRISEWRSQRVASKAVQQYRANNPSSTVSDGELLGTLSGSKLQLQRNSRLILITVKSTDPKLAAALANAYAEAIEAFTDEENKLRCDKAVAQIHNNVESRRREVDKIARKRLDFRTANKVDNLRSMRDTIQQGLSKATGDILALETQEVQLSEWEKLLAEVQKSPETFGNLSVGVPRAQEIAAEYRSFQDASGEYQGLLISYTDNHPEVIAKKKLLDAARQRFLDAASRALLTGRSSLQVVRNQLYGLRKKQETLRNDLASAEQSIVLAESGLAQLDADYLIANDVLKGLILDENKARLEASANNEIVRVGRPAGVPSAPISPNPTMIFGVGILFSLALGMVFVLVLDNIEDTIVNLHDIEQRLALKVLVVLPHVRRKKREQVARFIIEEKFSQFSEAVAGFRNLLDSPRYEALSHCMLIISTQPGEGKTITSCSLAVAYAQTGRKTLLVDFDLRRPRQVKIWNLELTKERSFSHVLQSAHHGEKLDFSRLINDSGVDGLSVIASLPPEGVTPATILGSSVVGEFFEWARANFDRIIVDSPPYGLVGDVVSLSVMVDSSIIMCCPDRTHFKPIQYCSRCLAEAGANILGVVVNDVEVSNSAAFSPARHHSRYGYGSKGYGYGYGYGYGGYGYGYDYGYGYSPKEEGDNELIKKTLTEKPQEDITDEE